MSEKVCKNCKLFVVGNVCPICKESSFTWTWKGIVVIYDPEKSEVAKTLNITVPGRYSL